MSHTDLIYHGVFSTKNRLPLITPELKQRLYDYTGGIIHKLRGRFVVGNGGSDHVHLLFSLPAVVCVAEAMRVIEANSSKWVHESFGNLSKFRWQTGYGAFTVGRQEIQRIVRYIENQETHHHKTSFQEEYISLLEEHGIEYDERYIWD